MWIINCLQNCAIVILYLFLLLSFTFRALDLIYVKYEVKNSSEIKLIIGIIP